MNNLPIPQSRSEELMNAFIQRDSSQISTPQSRIEEFWYHLIEGTNSLPIPQSRNELLLKKIIENDTHQIPLAQSRTEEFLVSILTGDINKLPIPQSRSEYYLDYIARNNLLLNDIDYVRYSGTNITATNTVQKPFRSAILKGQTLVNLWGTKREHFFTNGTFENSVLTSNGWCCLYRVEFFKPNTEYTLITNIISISDTNTYFKANNVSSNGIFKTETNKLNKVGIYVEKVVSYDDFTGREFSARSSVSGGGTIQFNMVVLEGDYTNVDIPYFEGMQSVKMPVLTTTGKNLLDVNDLIITDGTKGMLIEEADILLSGTMAGYNPSNRYIKLSLNRNTDYTIQFDGDNNVAWVHAALFNAKTFERTYYLNGAMPLSKTFNTGDCDEFLMAFGGISGIKIYKNSIQIEQGTTTTTYEPFKSNILTTTGKNLFDMNRPYDAITDSQATVVQDTNQITVSSAESGIYVNANFILDKDFFAGKTVTGSCLYESDEKDIGTVQITYQDGNGEHHYQWIRTPRTFTFPNSFIGDVMLSISANNTGTPQSNAVTVKNIQLELGSTATSYEPYSEVVLRGIGDVKDTLDLTTGELTQRIGEVVLDGSENWVLNDYFSKDGYSFFHIKEKITSLLSMKYQSKAKIDKVLFINQGEFVNSETIKQNVIFWDYYLILGLYNTNITTIEELKSWISQNPITVQYELATPTIKTVDLKVVNQDGNQVKELSAFDGTTHIVSGSASDNSLIAITEVEVPTKLIEVLDGVKSLSSDVEILINEVDNTQKLQDENSTMAMSAMTELYEMILMMGGND